MADQLNKSPDPDIIGDHPFRAEVLRLTAKDPGARFQTVAELATHIRKRAQLISSANLPILNSQTA
jgi:hypothetical protein